MPIKPSNDEMPNLNLTSMIDVLFLLIIFFVVGTKFIEEERQIALQVPSVGKSGAMSAAPEKRVVNVYRDGEITLDQKTVSLEELTSRLASARSQYKSLGVLVRGDGENSFQRIASVLTACKRAGIVDLGISVRQLENESANVRR